MQEIESSEFESEVLQAQVPAVVDFYADWCGPCRAIAPIMEQLSKEYEGRVKFVKLDIDANQDLLMKYGIMSIPTTLIFKAGRVMTMIIGAAPAAAFRRKIDLVV